MDVEEHCLRCFKNGLQSCCQKDMGEDLEVEPRHTWEAGVRERKEGPGRVLVEYSGP